MRKIRCGKTVQWATNRIDCAIYPSEYNRSMNPIRKLRDVTSLTQTALATLGSTSQPTIAAYESGRKSPTFRTIEFLAQAAGLTVECDFVRPPTREDARSRAYHSVVLQKLATNEQDILKRARHNLEYQTSLHPHARRLFHLWDAWLDLPLTQLREEVMRNSELAADMRQVSPFSGVLTAGERRNILKQFNQGARNESRPV